MPAFSLLKLSDKLAAQGTVTTYGILHPEDLSSANDIQAVEEQESLSFRYSRVDRFGAVRPITAAGRYLIRHVRRFGHRHRLV